jgi:2-hydroxychromene-2-carboxylate isomerase
MHVLAATHERTLEPVPVLFAALLDHFGHLGPAEIPSKRDFIFKQCIRRAARHGIPFAPPPSHPFNPLLGLRIASLDLGDDRVRVIDRLYDMTWGDGPGITDPRVVAPALDELGLGGTALVEQAQTPENKQRVKDQTATALERGAFGVPTIFADGELFWGDDSLEDLEVFLRGKDPASPDKIQRWANLPSSAQRPGSRR